MQRFLISAFVIFILAIHCAYATELAAIKIKGFDKASVVPGQKFANFKDIYLAPTQLTFNSQWLSDHRHDISAKERDALAAQYAKLMDESLRTRLTTQGWQLAAAPAANVLVISPQVNEFFLNAPDIGVGISKSFVYVAGHGRVDFTLALADGRVLAQLSDFSQTHERGGSKLSQTNRGLNLWDFRQLMQRWSDRLGQFMHNN